MTGAGEKTFISGADISVLHERTCVEALKVVEPEELLPAAREVAETVMAKAPLSLMLAKRMVDGTLDMDRRSGIGMGTLAKEEGTAAFLEKRLPRYEGK